ncbi:hypothetical protein [Polynucleobacter sp. AM-25C3]|uniref:hypothetical protein n=1 Tax=Polynucleobacter sp. AM-25C3 TaxID=1855569 RepID=UPI001C0C3F56|nr:hypothetical protein [Polynucleobacter sp. AM-25C3]MBU3602559.1 hypothetical protein [Polynucleobacter sp. AM-25C3]
MMRQAPVPQQIAPKWMEQLIALDSRKSSENTFPIRRIIQDAERIIANSNDGLIILNSYKTIMYANTILGRAEFVIDAHEKIKSLSNSHELDLMYAGFLWRLKEIDRLRTTLNDFDYTQKLSENDVAVLLFLNINIVNFFKLSEVREYVVHSNPRIQTSIFGELSTKFTELAKRMSLSQKDVDLRYDFALNHLISKGHSPERNLVSSNPNGSIAIHFQIDAPLDERVDLSWEIGEKIIEEFGDDTQSDLITFGVCGLRQTISDAN